MKTCEGCLFWEDDPTCFGDDDCDGFCREHLIESECLSDDRCHYTPNLKRKQIDKMKTLTFVTFGQDHNHTVDGKEFNKDCVAVIEASSAAHGRTLAFETFGKEFCFEYPVQHFDFNSMGYFPRGFISVNF